MVQIAREKMARLDDARTMMRQLYRSEVDLIPDHKNKTLTVRLHHLTTNVHDQIITHLCTELNATETVFPGCCWPTNTGLSDCVWLFAEESANGLRFL